MLFLPLPRGVRPTALAAVVPLLIACDGRGSRLMASWDGPDAGELKAPAVASWCPGARRLEIEAIKGDAGVALVIYPVKALRPGRYEAFDPGLYPMQRPGSAAALRWFSEQEVQGYQSDSGSAQVTEGEAGYQVRFGYRMIAATLLDTLRLAGEISEFAPGACPAGKSPDSTEAE
ncbi:MAG: hypothetical protein OEW17_11505 [Gemmatimonadota bacterium]|nr:hypothetical protein [Gemmatimonadota bacterium]MDH4349424.1 hypothetical protein [Gemmatimonadota bacterium]MDH5284573.1 hypothetical protein [Gemmatimonadota bacterium]